ncbi:uncharacterized protein LOC114941950 [Nylanderia fulva]|uniref:uncharacterized protein LOC114941950 n=1 Tax=Nylanderia fulva TaxID=613905 RepID=UPI0010FB6F6D|nr:uncharacterized protein LOC114941950 [Nylanderia fulva]XP_029172985.1 uncharacterized protein LOC114941950 [Nylanderia fulva]XP_029172986.1 uncharacterized protein LOC114941950 [Nylanderia fulva]
MCDELTKRPRRSFAEAWLNDDRYKSWICKVPSDNSLYYCSVCNKTFSCTSTHISRHADSACHKNNIKTNTLVSDDDCNDDVDLPMKKSRKSIFQQKWLDIEQFKFWLREVPEDANLFFCSICEKSIAGGLSHIQRHAESKTHINMFNKNNIEVNKSNADLNTQINESPFFDECRKSTEIKYKALMADKTISPQTAKEILSFFQYIGKDLNVLKSMSMGRTKCKNIIINVLYPVEMDRIINRLQNTKFSVFFYETSDTTNKWMIVLVRYVDSETLDIRLQLIQLINIGVQDSSAEKLFQAFKCEMRKLQIPFPNIVAFSCDNASVMTGKHLLFKKMLEKCPHLLAFSCPCYSAALAAHAACTKMPACCEEFLKKIANYLNNNPRSLIISHELCECFQVTNRKTLKLHDTCLLSDYLCIERFLESWDTIKHSLTEMVVCEKTDKEYLLLMMNNVEIKAYFLFLKYILNFFNTFSTFFETIETRIHLLQSKSENFLLQICRNFLKEKKLKSFSRNILSKGEDIFSVKENQKAVNEITLGSECEKYLVELTLKGHIDIVRIVRENCLIFYVTAAEEIYKKLPIKDEFLSKLQVFQPHVSLFNGNREQSFNDVSFVAKTIGFDETGFDENALKKEWIELPSDFTIKEKRSFSKLSFDNMWKEILQHGYINNIDKYPNLRKLLNAIRSFPNSNDDPERMLSLLNNLKPKQRKKLSPASINAICVFKSALKARGETAITMIIDEKHLSLMSANKLYTNEKKDISTKKDKSILELHDTDCTNIASSSSHK